MGSQCLNALSRDIDFSSVCFAPKVGRCGSREHDPKVDRQLLYKQAAKLGGWCSLIQEKRDFPLEGYRAG